METAGFDAPAITNLASMFIACRALRSLDLSGWDTSKVTSMHTMFFGCNSLESLDLTGWDTSSVTDMDRMFTSCPLASLDVSKWNTSQVTKIGSMFSGCSNLTSLDVSGWDTSSTTEMTGAFDGCTSLKSLDLSRWDTSAVTHMKRMFENCSSLEEVSIGANFRFVDDCTLPSNIVNGSVRWYSPAQKQWYSADEIASNRSGIADTYIKSKDLPAGYWGTCPWEIDENHTLRIHAGTGAELDSAASAPWHDSRQLIEQVTLDSDVKLPSNIRYMLAYCPNLTTVDASGWNMSGVAVIDGLFASCSSLESLDISDWDMSSVIPRTLAPLYGCNNLSSIDLSGARLPVNCNSLFADLESLNDVDAADVDASLATYMYAMFAGCPNLVSIDLSGWNTSSLVDTNNMFASDISLKSVNVSGWDVPKLENVAAMFASCGSLESVDLSSWDTSSLVYADAMFVACGSLKSLDLSGWDVSKVVSMGTMFAGNGSLESIDITGWKMPDTANVMYMFAGCSKLKSLDLSGWNTTVPEEGSSLTMNFLSGCESLSEIKVGEGFQFDKTCGIPIVEINGHKDWFSTRDARWYTVYEILESRSGIPDTYTKVELISLADAIVTVSPTSYTYTGKAITPAPKVVLGDKTLKASTDYTVSYKNNVEVGTATVTVTGKGD